MGDLKENRFRLVRLYLSNQIGVIITQRELAASLEISQGYISQLESGEKQPTYSLAAKLQEKYDIPIRWFIRGEGLAPWEEKEYEIAYAFADEQEKQKKGSGEAFASFLSLSFLRKTPEKKLLDYFIEAGRNPEFRLYIYNVLQYILEGGTVNVFQEMQRAGEEASDLTFESTEIVLKFPGKPAKLSGEESERWDQNELALRRWEKTQAAFNVPTRALEKFCRQVVGLYEGGKPKDIGDLLKDFMEENKK